MLSIKGTYDGKELKLSKELEIKEPKEVITDFLESEDEDLYTDEDLKVNYK